MVEDVLVPVNHSAMSASQIVLILVVVEDVLVHALEKMRSSIRQVLILVVVEDVLVPLFLNFNINFEPCLNPCCGGRCSSTFKKNS